MDTQSARKNRPAEFWNDDARQLLKVVSCAAVGGYVLMHPRVLRFALVLGTAELVRRRTGLSLSLPSVRTGHQHRKAIQAKATITVSCEPETAYAYWRNLTNAPRFMSAVDEVRVVSDNVAVWKMHPMQGKTISWVGETIEDVPGERISWRIIGSDVISGTGSVEFRKGLRPGTTEIRLHQELHLPIRFSNWLSRSLMTRRLEETLRRLRQLLETGEVARTEGQPAGERTFAGRLSHDYVKPVLIPS
jgi:uncharacterized membrane protein